MRHGPVNAKRRLEQVLKRPSLLRHHSTPVMEHLQLPDRCRSGSVDRHKAYAAVYCAYLIGCDAPRYTWQYDTRACLPASFTRDSKERKKEREVKVHTHGAESIHIKI